MSFRAVDTLKSVDLILCEDTRVSGKLLQFYDIKKPLLSLHDHNEESRATHILNEIEKGQAVALISDAGMPLISDPGYKLVRACIHENINITSIPGASSVLMALQLSGLPSDKFLFIGFTPTKSKARQELLARYKFLDASIILFENGLRTKDTLKDIKATFGNRTIAIARELTKLFETVIRGTAEELINKIETDGAPKGEVVLIIEGAHISTETANDFDLDDLITTALKHHSLKDAVAIVVDQTGLKKKEIYARALEIQNQIQDQS